MDKRKASDADLLKDNIVINQNKKKISEDSDFAGGSMLKRNEMSLVLLGAGVLTVILFFLFFRPSEELNNNGVGEDNNQAVSSAALKSIEERLTRLEEALQTFDIARGTIDSQTGSGNVPELEQFGGRLERVETALSVKFDIVTARVDKMEDNLIAMSKDISRNARAAALLSSKEKATASSPSSSSYSKNLKTTSSSQQTSEAGSSSSGVPVAVKKQEVENQPDNTKTSISVSTKKAANTESSKAVKSEPEKENVSGKSPLYHTIEKGDTLYNISKKYNTTVAHLRKINQMATKDPIMIGQKIIVRE
ncbi:hypothetical protein MTBBW1_940010 [Desulfamplus magnetovallimortis]|uniref:LysM domain-containing protein n=1 Tax=Desulfamplus magnetovallimortis TaxID=1246637 RepID=A0A1W1HL21_9BACT|nr:LysM peptidoglycan-binding domain-containing protein [Desulfamplus magnetovallimortis]SLM33191.1 hypothetical protein MTBBW1_940010 [Desulfamplus magnetovallimortis]